MAPRQQLLQKRKKPSRLVFHVIHPFEHCEPSIPGEHQRAHCHVSDQVGGGQRKEVPHVLPEYVPLFDAHVLHVVGGPLRHRRVEGEPLLVVACRDSPTSSEHSFKGHGTNYL